VDISSSCHLLSLFIDVGRRNCVDGDEKKLWNKKKTKKGGGGGGG
jgi:hypothetical protein